MANLGPLAREISADEFIWLSHGINLRACRGGRVSEVRSQRDFACLVGRGRYIGDLDPPLTEELDDGIHGGHAAMIEDTSCRGPIHVMVLQCLWHCESNVYGSFEQKKMHITI